MSWSMEGSITLDRVQSAGDSREEEEKKNWGGGGEKSDPEENRQH